MYEGSIIVRLKAELRELDRLHRVVRDFGELHELPERMVPMIKLALDEAVSNVIRHGYEDAKNQVITVHLAVSGSEIWAEIEDEGRPFNPLEADVPDLSTPLPERSLGGLGIHLMRNLMDSLTHAREGSKNILTLRKRIR